MKVLAVLQARMTSTRLPGKVLLPLLGRPMLARQLERVRRARELDGVIVATSSEPADDPIAALAAELAVGCFRGSLDDVLDRFYRAALGHAPEHVVRLTGDCPLACPEMIDRVVRAHLDGGHDYTSNALERTFPDGLDVEAVRFACLEEAWREAALPSEREHVTPFLYHRPDRFRLGSVVGDPDRSGERWVVDEPADFALVTRVYEALYPGRPDFGTADVLALFAREPALRRLNAAVDPEAGWRRSLAADAAVTATETGSGAAPGTATATATGDGHGSPPRRSYARSEAMLERARRTIPLGSQTFSKSVTHLPLGAAPLYAARGEGSRLIDVDGHAYIDFVNGLAAVVLGYKDPDVDEAVRRQLDAGVTFSLPHPLEHEVAEALVEVIPCAEMVRFGKNGSDATAAAIRVARAFTGRDHVAVCGYHGWQDWYIGSTARSLGVPAATRALTHAFAYNDAPALERLLAAHPAGFAAVILEPMGAVEPLPGFLARARDLAHAHGALLIFDETITGFRFALGGAQALAGVTPDLATFGKGLANGYPLSAVVGRAEVMRLFEEVFFSTTFGGETLSLAAARAVVAKMRREPVLETLAARGQRLLRGVEAVIQARGAAAFARASGHPSWSFLFLDGHGPYSSWEVKTFFLQETFARGILTLGTHNLSYAHSEADIDRLIEVYDEVFAALVAAIGERTLAARLRAAPLQPLFRVR